MPKKRTVGINRAIKQKVTVRDGWQYKTIEVRSIGGLSLWELFKQFINSIPVGSDFTRKDLLYALYTRESAEAIRAKETTPDQYRNRCCHVGLIEVIGRGKYRKLHDIPEKLTSSHLSKSAAIYSSRTWRMWAVPKYKRVEALIEACK